jgi:hypothetical protein
MVSDRLRLPVAVERELALVLDRMPAPVSPLLNDRAVIAREPRVLNPVLDDLCDGDQPGDLMLSPGSKYTAIATHSSGLITFLRLLFALFHIFTRF